MSELRCGTCGQKADDETMNELQEKLDKALPFIANISESDCSCECCMRCEARELLKELEGE